MLMFVTMAVVWTATGIAFLRDVERNRALGYDNPAADKFYLFFAPAILIGRYIGPIVVFGALLFFALGPTTGAHPGDSLTFGVLLFVILLGLVLSLFQGALLVFFPRANMTLGLGSLLAGALVGGLKVSPLIAWAIDFVLGAVSPVLPLAIQTVVLVASAAIIVAGKDAV